jgi:DNA replication protein DnaC
LNVTADSVIADIEERERQDRRFEAWQRSGIPARHRKRVLEGNWAKGAWVDAGKETLEAALSNRLVFLVGQRGTGKTQLAGVVARIMCMKHGISPHYYRMADWLGDFKRAAYDDGERESRLLARHARGLLILDEIQERYDTKAEDLILTRLIDHRYGAMAPTILIANLKPDELRATLGASVMSRSDEIGKLIVLDGENFRRQKA